MFEEHIHFGAKTTLECMDVIINTLKFASMSLRNVIDKEEAEEEQDYVLHVTEFAGLCYTLESMKDTVATCVTFHCRDPKALQQPFQKADPADEKSAAFNLNPIIKHSVRKTLDEVTSSLLFLAIMMDRYRLGDAERMLTSCEASGLYNLINCNITATEYCRTYYIDYIKQSNDAEDDGVEH